MKCRTKAEYDWFVKGAQSQKLNTGRFVRNDQVNGYGARLGVDWLIPSSFGCFDYKLGAFLRYWNIDKATINIDSFGQPYSEAANTTYEIGLRLGLAF
jgi:hypothetical protein